MSARDRGSPVRRGELAFAAMLALLFGAAPTVGDVGACGQEATALDEATFAAIVAFCSVLPGPTSSQVGMLIGLMRAGAGGAFAAWLGFTAPSAIAMTGCCARTSERR